MGDHEGLDERVFATLDHVRDYGCDKWWLYVSSCKACGQNWMVAQDERIHDNFVLKRIDQAAMDRIIESSEWPTDFLRLEDVLRLESESGKVAYFLNYEDSPLKQTAIELRRERPNISIEDIAFVLAISPKSAERLLQG